MALFQSPFSQVQGTLSRIERMFAWLTRGCRSDLPDGNRTTDEALARLADGEDRVVVTKDRDFRDSHLLNRSPRHLLVVATGNITNRGLLSLVEENAPAIVDALAESPFVELSPAGLILHAEPD